MKKILKCAFILSLTFVISLSAAKHPYRSNGNTNDGISIYGAASTIDIDNA